MTKMTKDELIAVLRSLERKGRIESRIVDGEFVGASPQRASPWALATRTGRRTADTDWTRSNEHLSTMRSAGNLRLPRQEHGEMTWYCTTHRLGQHRADALREACAAGCTAASPVRENAACLCRPPAVTSERTSEAAVP